MTDATRSQLEQAYRLIQQDDLDRAIAILKPIVAAEPDNADAWWLMAHAVSEPQDAREPLENVLRLRPDHAEARQLLNELEQEASLDTFGEAPEPFPQDTSLDNLFGDTPEPPSAPSTVSSSELDELLGQSPVPSGAEDLSFLSSDTTSDFSSFDMNEPVEAPTDDLFVDPFAGSEPGFVADALGEEQKKADSRKAKRDKAAKEREKAERERAKQQAKLEREAAKAAKAAKAPLDPLEAERRFNSRPNPAVLAALFLVIVVVVGGGVTYALLPRLLNQAAEAPTIPVTPGTVVTVAPAADVNSAIQAINDLFAANKFAEPKAAVVQTALGDTLQVQVCGVAGPKLLEDVNRAMDIVAKEASKIKDLVKAAGVLFVNCARPDSKLFVATAPMDAIVVYVNGGMADKKTYRAQWKRG
jgi:tetratricopeptide (TPR) repeat protein